MSGGSIEQLAQAAGGTQLRHALEDDGIFVWQFHLDWRDRRKTTLAGPKKIALDTMASRRLAPSARDDN